MKIEELFSLGLSKNHLAIILLEFFKNKKDYCIEIFSENNLENNINKICRQYKADIKINKRINSDSTINEIKNNTIFIFEGNNGIANEFKERVKKELRKLKTSENDLKKCIFINCIIIENFNNYLITKKYKKILTTTGIKELT